MNSWSDVLKHGLWIGALLVILFLVFGRPAHAEIPTYPEYHWRLVAVVEFVLIKEEGYRRETAVKIPMNPIEYKTPNECAKEGEQVAFPLPLKPPPEVPEAQMVNIITCLPYKHGSDTKDKTP